jgi:hypothetical protein
MALREIKPEKVAGIRISVKPDKKGTTNAEFFLEEVFQGKNRTARARVLLLQQCGELPLLFASLVLPPGTSGL